MWRKDALLHLPVISPEMKKQLFARAPLREDSSGGYGRLVPPLPISYRVPIR
ncbi:MAG: hypothetical protein R3E31_14255 [Chloroflexota bacterium]